MKNPISIRVWMASIVFLAFAVLLPATASAANFACPPEFTLGTSGTGTQICRFTGVGPAQATIAAVNLDTAGLTCAKGTPGVRGWSGRTPSLGCFDADGKLLTDPDALVAGSPLVALTQDQVKAKAANEACGLTTFTFERCIWQPLMSLIGSWFLTIGGAFLRLSGALFDTLIQYIIIGYSTTLDTLNISSAISIGWTVFRDFSNILIIGLFVFIAISIILGLQEFGQKKLIANVLVVAVLMNFSLLFTKLIIDGSNFISYQIYNQMAGANGAQSANFDVAQSFLTPMKIGSIWDTYGLVSNVAKETGSGVQAFAFGLVGGIMLLAAAAVLFYGSFLIAWRGVLFLVLMLTAPLAFATYLVPSLAKGEYGWNSWWKMLINNAAFGPLLMILLAISLSILNAAGAKTSTPIGNIIANPGSAPAGAWTTILVYIIGIGLLFASMKLASNFAGSIGGGFNFATGLAKLAGFAPVAGAAAFAGGGMRRLIGGNAALKALGLDEAISKQKIRASMAPLGAEQKAEQKYLLNLMNQKKKAEGVASRQFNFENTALGKALQKAGMPSVSGDTKGGFAGARKAAAEEAAKAVAPLAVSNKEAEAAAREHMKEQQHTERERVEQERQTQAALVETAKSVADSAKRSEQLEEKHVEAQKSAALIKDSVSKEKINIDDQHSRGVIDRAARERAIEEQDARIKVADESVKNVKDRMQTIEDTHLANPQAALRKVELEKSRLDRELEDGVKTVTKKIVESSLANAQDIGVDIAHAHNDAYTSSEVRRLTKKSFGNARLKDRIKLEKEITEEVDGPSAPRTTS